MVRAAREIAVDARERSLTGIEAFSGLKQRVEARMVSTHKERIDQCAHESSSLNAAEPVQLEILDTVPAMFLPPTRGIDPRMMSKVPP